MVSDCDCSSPWLTSTRRNAHSWLSEKEIRRQARVEWLQMKRHLPLEPDARITRYVQCIANNIIAQLPRRVRRTSTGKSSYSTKTQINAFADPNGKIGVFNGILKTADTPDALAAVIGHEVAHATEGHVMAASAQECSPRGLGDARRRGHGATDVWRQSIAHRPRSAVRSRTRDRGGPGRARATWPTRASTRERRSICGRTWPRRSKPIGRERPPEFLSTHPSDSARIDNMIKSLTPALVKYNAAREAGKRPPCTIAR